MRIQFLGATDTVTGSRTLLQHDGHSLLVDCGLFQGYKQLRLRNRDPLPVDPAGIDAVILTHAHTDHSGWLPVLARQGFRGKVWCTPATRDLCRILLLDAAHLQEEEAEYANRHGFSRHQPALPLFTREDALRSLKLFHSVPLHKPWHPLPGLTARLAPSGHMLGSAFVQVDDGTRSILFSGDLGRPQDLLLKPPERLPGADYLVLESTYGNRLHPHGDVLAQLEEVIRRTAGRGGSVLIPAFAVGRAQTMLHCIRLLKSQRRIPPVPVFLNSPMAASALQAYREHRDELAISTGDLDALSDVAQIVETADESRALNARRGPMVIIAASGMATGGRVVHHLKALAPDHRNTILFAGQQAGGTRGATLLDGAPTVRIHGQDIPVRAQVEKLDDLSAHADAQEILDWLRGFRRPPARTFINHGEPDAADALRQRIERELGWNCTVPGWLDGFELR
ncbi:MAG TPA: MBL fold metallo-hydrolase [Ramlibacter sp.]|nr:MBL fold metallo-hydrolase [Ramlibacter sp.]